MRSCSHDTTPHHRVSLEDIHATYQKHWFWGRVLNPKPKQPSNKLSKDKSQQTQAPDKRRWWRPRQHGGGDGQTEKQLPTTLSKQQQQQGRGVGVGGNDVCSSSSGVPNTAKGGNPAGKLAPPDAAACADITLPTDSNHQQQHHQQQGEQEQLEQQRQQHPELSPFGTSEVQLLVRTQSRAVDAADDPQTAAAVAAAASIALGGAASAAAGSSGSLQGGRGLGILQHGGRSRKAVTSLRLGGRRRSSMPLGAAGFASSDAVNQLADELGDDD